MVKNTKGGNRHKKMSSKHLTEDEGKVRTRLANPKEKCEVYATVTKMYGQGNCEVMCCDGKQRLCVIRKSFKGRNKSRNFIAIDTKVLVGLRNWETPRDGKREKCDLLEVYERSQHRDLKKDPACKWEMIASVDEEIEGDPEELLLTELFIQELRHKPEIKFPHHVEDKEQTEISATVTKMYGQGNCEVMCCDGKQRLCIIRKGFKDITVCTKVLVGLRNWEVPLDDNLEKCDLLEVEKEDVIEHDGEAINFDDI